MMIPDTSFTYDYFAFDNFVVICKVITSLFKVITSSFKVIASSSLVVVVVASSLLVIRTLP